MSMFRSSCQAYTDTIHDGAICHLTSQNWPKAVLDRVPICNYRACAHLFDEFVGTFN